MFEFLVASHLIDQYLSMEMNGDSDGAVAHLDHHERRYRRFEYLIPAHIVNCAMARVYYADYRVSMYKDRRR